MPTGYTAGILSGKIKTFHQFAKLCMKAFGACYHMRDDDMYAEYKMMSPDPYYKEELEDAKKRLKEIQELSDFDIIYNHKKTLNKRKKEVQLKISEIIKNRNKLETFLKKAQTYVPPTPDHTGVKTFMIEQLVSTIEHDGDTEYYDKELILVEDQLNNIDAVKIRNVLIKTAEDDIKYYTEHYQKEVDRCNENNKWVEDFYKSINENNISN